MGCGARRNDTRSPARNGSLSYTSAIVTITRWFTAKAGLIQPHRSTVLKPLDNSEEPRTAGLRALGGGGLRLRLRARRGPREPRLAPLLRASISMPRDGPACTVVFQPLPRVRMARAPVAH